jgi:putative Mn2+ efflux pump MntP
MSLWELFVIAVGLSMDACAVSICKGLSVGRVRPGHALTCGGYFGLFQGLMPLLGWLLGVRFQSVIVSIDHWIAFALLGLIGLNMIRESREDEEACLDCSFGFRAMLPLAIATSIDALAVGVTFAFLQVDIVPAVAFIGTVTFTLSAIGVWVGGIFGARFKSKAEFVGGAILMLMGTRILMEHLGLIG